MAKTSLRTSVGKSASKVAVAAAIATLSLAAPAFADDPQWTKHSGTGGGHTGGGGGGAPAHTPTPAVLAPAGPGGGAPGGHSGGGQSGGGHTGGAGGPTGQSITHTGGGNPWGGNGSSQGGYGAPDGGRGSGNQGWGDHRGGDQGHPEWGHDGNDRGWGDHHPDAQGHTQWRQGEYRPWGHDWRNDQRYDWRGWREGHRDAFHIGRYYPPYRDYAYSRLAIGFVLDPVFWGDSYYIYDPWTYRLPPADGPYRWVRYYDDAVLVDTSTGQVADVIYDFFW